jgi:hypothetical protein
MSSEQNVTEAPIMLRVDLTREELRLLKAQAALQGKTIQQLAGELLRAGVAA